MLHYFGKRVFRAWLWFIDVDELRSISCELRVPVIKPDTSALPLASAEPSAVLI
jgi:hypothetical protein